MTPLVDEKSVSHPTGQQWCVMQRCNIWKHSASCHEESLRLESVDH
jgi:hypothetical protein